MDGGFRPEAPPPEAPPAAAVAAAALEARDLTLVYRSDAAELLAVDRVSFAIGRGERLVLLGPSGCGKTSILKACAGFLKPDSGEVRVRGRPVAGPGPDRIVVFQEFDQLLPWKTALDNVAFPLVRARGLPRAEARERAAAALARVGLARAAGQWPHELSGGMKQRVAIARALAMEPEVLLMDEPFAALDALTRRRLQEELLDLVREAEATLLFVTHSIEEAALIGTRLHLLSAHPGRTLASLDAGAAAASGPGSAAFAALVAQVESGLFGRPAAVAGTGR